MVGLEQAGNQGGVELSDDDGRARLPGEAFRHPGCVAAERGQVMGQQGRCRWDRRVGFAVIGDAGDGLAIE